MNSFESEIINLLLETAYYNTSDIDSITPESCRQHIEDYAEFPWSEKRKMMAFFRRIEGIPSELVSSACLFAWGQVDWNLIAKSVKEELNEPRE